MAARRGVFTFGRNRTGSYTGTLADGSTRTLAIQFDANVANWARDVNVPEAEALAKIDWPAWERTFQSALNTKARSGLFGTERIDSMLVTGAWRPIKGVNTYEGKMIGSIPESLRSYENETWEKRIERNPHSRGLDIGRINQYVINVNTGPQPELVKQFSYNLRKDANVSQVIQPWMTYGVSGFDSKYERKRYELGFVSNALSPGVEWQHRHHLHISYQ